MIERINLLWAVPLLLPFVLVAMVRLSWSMIGLPWEPDEAAAAFIVTTGMAFSVISGVTVSLMQSEDVGIWWTFKKEKSVTKGTYDD